MLAFFLLSLQSAQAADNECDPKILSIHAARADTAISARPTQGWVPVTLPDVWTERWPDYSGSVWYKIDWVTGCKAPPSFETPALGLLINGISLAGAVYLNDGLLWRDASMTGPLSHSWNMPRWWPLPTSALRQDINTLWVHVVGAAELMPGMQQPIFGDASRLDAMHKELVWSQRSVYEYSAIITAAVGVIFFVIWCIRPQEKAFGWFALVSLFWGLWLLTGLLATSAWRHWPIPLPANKPYLDSLILARLNLVALVMYVHSFCIFTFRFGGQHLPRIERGLWVLSAIAITVLVAMPYYVQESSAKAVALGCVSVFFGNCLRFQWRAWKTRERDHILLALCCALYLAIGSREVWALLYADYIHETWGAVTSIATAVLMAVLLGSRLASNTREVERVNDVLESRIAQTSADLREVLDREHEQRLQHSRLQERVQLSRDLHDSLGASLVRSIAAVEHAQRTQRPMENERMLSLLKVLRNDLRQIIDYGSAAGAPAPSSPEHWLAPLRYRFSRLFDELEIGWKWSLDGVWHSARLLPGAKQRMNIERIIEESLTNTLKHSRANNIIVTCEQYVEDNVLIIRIEDDGVGFSPDYSHNMGSLHVGLRSMSARAQHCGATFEVQSAPNEGTRISVQLRGKPLSQSANENPQPQ